MTIQTITVLMMSLAIAGCGNVTCRRAAVQDERKELCGGYTAQRELSDEEKALFNEVAASSAEGFVPVSVATQVVAGINYKFICKGPSDETEIITIYKPLSGQARITSIEKTGEAAYRDIVSFIADGFSSRWAAVKPEDKGLSSVYGYCSKYTGYAITDINGDGIDELVIGDCFEEGPAVLYDIFTLDQADGTPVHLACGGERDRFHLLSDGTVVEEGSNSASDSFVRPYGIREGKLLDVNRAVNPKEYIRLSLVMFL